MDVGLRISATENVSSIGPKVVDSLRSIVKAGEEIQSALDLGDIEEQYKKFAEREERIFDQQRVRQGEIRQAQEPGRAVGPAVPTGITAALRTGGRTVQALGAGGDVVGAAPDVLGTLGGITEELTKGMPGWATKAGKIAAGIIGVAGGIVFAGNALSKQYEKVLDTVIGLTAALGRFGETAEETSRNFGKTMKEVSDKAAEFGMTFEEGAGIYTGLARISGRTDVGRAAEDVMSYARGQFWGVSPALLERYTGLGLRFGQQGNVLGSAAAGLFQSGMIPAQFGEYLESSLSVIEEGISKGIVRGFENVNIMRAWLSKLGPAFTGQYGIQQYMGMQQSIVGATGLQTEQDVITYRAALRALKGMTAGEKAKWEKGVGLQLGRPGFKLEPGDIGVMQFIEQEGLSPRMFGAHRELYREITGGNRSDMIRMLRERFPALGYLNVPGLLDLPPAEAVGLVPSGFGKIKGTPEMGLLSSQNRIMSEIRDSAKELIPIKTGIIRGAADLIETMNRTLGIGETGRTETERQASLLPLAGIMGLGFKGSIGGAIVPQTALGMRMAGNKIMDTILRGAAGGPGQAPALDILKLMEQSGLAGLGAEGAEELVSKLFGTDEAPGVMHVRSAGGAEVLSKELNNLSAILHELADKFDKTVEKAGKLEVNVATEETQPSQATGYPEGYTWSPRK